MLIADGFWEDICSGSSGVPSILQVVGWAIMIFKIAIPFIIVFYGMLDFGKAVTAEKTDEIKASAKRLLYRAIAGIIIFLIPQIVVWLFETITTFGDDASEFTNCKQCLLHPASSDCDTSGTSTGGGNG